MRQDAMLDASKDRPHYARHFLLTTLLTISMLCAMTLYYGFLELERTARDVAAAVLKDLELQKIRHHPPSQVASSALNGFHDASQIEVCMADRCITQRAKDDVHISPDLINSTGLPCGTASNSGVHDSVRVCMAVDDVVEDISRDVLVLLIAQSIGFAIWWTASRRYAARRKALNDLVDQAEKMDSATGLLNRAAFRDAVGAAAKRGDEAWLVTVGIDELKMVNQLHGSPVGDEVIQQVVHRLRKLEGAHTWGRLGGDEFAFLVRGSGPATLERALFQLRAAMNAPVRFQGLILPVTVSAGAVPVEQNLPPAELKRRANVALRAAKRVGADSQSIFNEAYDIELRNAHQMRLDLMAAVEKGQVELAYQPISDGQGALVMAEALARWNHPVHGPVAPDVFIAVAESSGLIHQLGVDLLKMACADLVAARARGLPLQRISVNLSPSQLNNPDLAQIVIGVLKEAGLQPADIELELTESAAMASRNDATQQLQELAEQGFAISIDDFGTGYSSLSRLQTLPIRKLKIDRSFVQACHQPSGAALLDAMIELSRRLELSCVAEGVETPSQMDWLRERGCQLFQGYLIGKPMSLERLVASGAGRAGRGQVLPIRPNSNAARAR